MSYLSSNGFHVGHVVFAQGLADPVPLLQKACGKRGGSGRRRTSSAWGRLPDQQVALMHRRIEDVPLDLIVAIQKISGLGRERIGVKSQPELDVGRRVPPARDVLAHHQEDEGERHQPAAGRPERPPPAHPPLRPESILVPLLPVGRQHRTRKPARKPHSRASEQPTAPPSPRTARIAPTKTCAHSAETSPAPRATITRK